MPDVDRKKYHMFALRVSLSSKHATLRQMLMHVRDSDNVITRNLSYEWVHTLLKENYNHKDYLAVHGNKFFDLRETHTTTMQGLKHCIGASRTLRLNATDSPVMLEGLCTKLFFPTTSVAHFIENYYGLQLNLGLPWDYEKLDRTLRGKLVRIRTSQGYDKRAIYMVERKTPATAKADEKHYAWRSKSNLPLHFPTLPLLNVGTPRNHVVVPPEMCTFKPMQSFRGNHTLGLEQDLTAERKKMAEREQVPEGARVKLGETLCVVRYEKPDTDDLNKQLKEAFNVTSNATSGPNVLFVEADVTKHKTAAWDHVQKAIIKNKILKGCEMSNIQEIPPLFLQCPPGKDPTDQWNYQLRKFVESHETKQKTVLVVALQPDQYEKHMYKIIKYLGDCQVGVQTFFVNLATVQQKIRKFGPDGPSKAANELVSRMRVRNTPELPKPPNGPKSIAIAYHIARINVGVPDPRNKTSSNPSVRYLVVFASRHMDESKYYNTKVILKSPKDILEYNPKTDLFNFLSHLLPTGNAGDQHQVVIFRSGFILPESHIDDKSEHGRLMKPNTDFNDLDSYHKCGSLGDFKALDDEVSVAEELQADRVFEGKEKSASKANSANYEFLYLRAMIRKRFHDKSKVTYVLVGEDNDFAFSDVAKRSIADEIA